MCTNKNNKGVPAVHLEQNYMESQEHVNQSLYMPTLPSNQAKWKHLCGCTMSVQGQMTSGQKTGIDLA